MTYNKEEFVYWIREREAIRIRKMNGLDKPWSRNQVMQQTYFCNIDREDDKVTQWIRENWQYTEHELGESHKATFIVAMAAARLFNLPEFLEEIQQPIDDTLDYWFGHIEDTIFDRKNGGQQCWGGAYMISTHGQKCDKGDYCIRILKDIAEISEKIDGYSTLFSTHKELMTIHGISSFMAGQIVADLKNSEGHPLQRADDWHSFSAPGPGSLRGLSWYFEEKATKKTYQERMVEVYEDIQLELSEKIMKKLCMQNLQNCLCEYDKFMRVTTGVGRSKRKYEGK